MRAHVLAALAVGLLLGADAPKGDARKEKDKLQGTWKAATVEKRGEAKDDAEGHRLVFSGDEFRIKRGDQTVIKGKFTLDPSPSTSVPCASPAPPAAPPPRRGSGPS